MDGKGRGSSNNNNNTLMSEDEMDLRRGPWTVDEDLTLMNYIATHGEGRWNTLALSAGLKRTGKSCRLRWLNYLRPDVRRGNITLEEQLLILELHTRWGNRWSKIAQYLPGRTDNEIKNYWRTRVQKLAKQLKCDVNSKQFKDTMRYLWMPRLVERIQAAAAAATTNNNTKMELTPTVMKNEFAGSQSHVTQSYINNNNNTPENSSTGASSDSFGSTTQVSTFSDLADNNNNYYNNSVPVISSNGNNPNNIPLEYYQQPSQLSYSDCITSPSGLLFPQDFQPNTPWMQSGGDSSDIFWNAENMLFLQQQLMNDTTM